MDNKCSKEGRHAATHTGVKGLDSDLDGSKFGVIERALNDAKFRHVAHVLSTDKNRDVLNKWGEETLGAKVVAFTARRNFGENKVVLTDGDTPAFSNTHSEKDLAQDEDADDDREIEMELGDGAKVKFTLTNHMDTLQGAIVTVSSAVNLQNSHLATARPTTITCARTLQVFLLRL